MMVHGTKAIKRDMDAEVARLVSGSTIAELRAGLEAAVDLRDVLKFSLAVFRAERRAYGAGTAPGYAA